LKSSHVLERFLNIQGVLNMFINMKLINQSNDGYTLLSTSKRLTWQNIQYIEELDTENIPIVSILSNMYGGDERALLVKMLFWYFRKFIVDSIVSILITLLKSDNMKHAVALSVGSTKMSSDYDITLFGNYKNVAKIIKYFNTIVYAIFNNTPDKVFDTNLYGVSFIALNTMYKNELLDKHKESLPILPKLPKSPTFLDVKSYDLYSDEKSCQDKSIHVLGRTNQTASSQHVWAITKVLYQVFSIKDPIYRNVIENEILSKGNIIVKHALSLYETLMSSSGNETYVNVLFSFMKFKDVVGRNNIDNYTLYNNFISFVNFFGSETYFTRGAFLDVVVNQQMCKSNVVQLDTHEYIDSALENISELFSHYQKEKYTIRAIDALKQANLTNDIKELEDILQLQRHCMIKCNTFLIYTKTLNVLSKLLDTTLMYYKESDVQVIKNIIANRTTLFSSTIESNSIIE